MEIITKKPDCGMNFNCDIVNFDVKLSRLYHKLVFIENKFKDKLPEEELSYLTQAKLEAEDLVQQFYREYEIKKN